MSHSVRISEPMYGYQLAISEPMYGYQLAISEPMYGYQLVISEMYGYQLVSMASKIREGNAQVLHCENNNFENSYLYEHN